MGTRYKRLDDGRLIIKPDLAPEKLTGLKKSADTKRRELCGHIAFAALLRGAARRAKKNKAEKEPIPVSGTVTIEPLPFTPQEMDFVSASSLFRPPESCSA